MNTEREKTEEQPDAPEPKPHKFTVPGWVGINEDIGLGDAIIALTHRIGFRTCDQCGQRAAALNRKVVFTRR